MKINSKTRLHKNVAVSGAGSTGCDGEGNVAQGGQGLQFSGGNLGGGFTAEPIRIETPEVGRQACKDCEI